MNFTEHLINYMKDRDDPVSFREVWCAWKTSARYTLNPGVAQHVYDTMTKNRQLRFAFTHVIRAYMRDHVGASEEECWRGTVEPSYRKSEIAREAFGIQFRTLASEQPQIRRWHFYRPDTGALCRYTSRSVAEYSAQYQADKLAVEIRVHGEGAESFTVVPTRHQLDQRDGPKRRRHVTHEVPGGRCKCSLCATPRRYPTPLPEELDISRNT